MTEDQALEAANAGGQWHVSFVQELTGHRSIATGCVADPSLSKPPREAEKALANYIARKYEPARRESDVEEDSMSVTDTLAPRRQK